jgi:hypothetical protein
MTNIVSARALAWAASITTAAWFAASPAAAQVYPAPGPYYGVAPAQVIARVQSMGLQPVSEPHLRGPVWAVRAQGRDGTLVRVLIDAQSGRVVNIVALERAYPPPIAARGSINEGPWVPMGPGEEDLAPPGYGPPAGHALPPSGYPTPGAYPGPQSGGPVQLEKKLATRPSTPLPKPRPSDAQDVGKSQTPAVAAAPKEPETTSSVPARKVESADPAKSQEPPPVNPLD